MPRLPHCDLLDGLRVIDLTGRHAAYCSRLLVDLGASVIRVVRPGTQPPHGGSGAFRYSNAGKACITLDISQPKGREILSKMAGRADAMVESFPPGYLDAHGLSFEALAAVNPGLILVSLTGFGQTGPNRHHRSCGLVDAACGGQMSVCGPASGAPLAPPAGTSSHATSLYGAIGLLLALARRRISGKGEHVDISTQEVVASMLDHVLVRYLYDGIVAERQGAVSWNRMSFILPCRDGHIQVNIAAQWEVLVEWMASEGMAEDLVDEKWRDENRRFEGIDHVIGVLRRWTRTHAVDELFHAAQALRFPWAPVQTAQDVRDCPQLAARGCFAGAARPADAFPGMPCRFDDAPVGAPPRLASAGEDNLRIYCDELGIPADELDRLRAAKVI
ncbi:MAG: CoA transferase [Burkholderiaceae bacterium]|nr:CoA transferase [Burkholderiaceae bacterium]